jgi:hypothetical protein
LKKIVLYAVFLILFIEISGNLAYRIVKGVFLWDVYKHSSVFNIRPFTELVDDDRVVTTRKNFECNVYRDCLYSSARPSKENSWNIKTDSNGFRIGSNRYFSDRPNILFCGDSVPFGWGVEADESVPSFLYDMLIDKGLDYGVINGALPAHSLYQATRRYEYEIDGKFPLKCVIFQIYDPAPQLLIWGRQWNKRMSWASRDSLVKSGEVVTRLIKPNAFMSFLNRYSFTNHVIYVVKIRLQHKQMPAMALDFNDKEAFDYFDRENTAILEDFYAILSRKKIPLVILPVNPTRPLSYLNDKQIKALPDKERGLLKVVEHLNGVLYKFASTHKDVYYFDVLGHFNRIGREGMFVDAGCHLSKEGSRAQAQFIYDELVKNNLL